jgi:hypothetical protein
MTLGRHQNLMRIKALRARQGGAASRMPSSTCSKQDEEDLTTDLVESYMEVINADNLERVEPKRPNRKKAKT